MSRDRRLQRRSVVASGSTGVAAAFDPSQISSLRSWYRADLGITLNGSTVSAWADQGPAGANGTQGTASQQPTWDDSDAGLNNQACVIFEGFNDVMNFGSVSSYNYIHDGTGGAFWIVFRTPAVLDGGTLASTNNSTASSIGFYLYHNGGGTLDFQIGSGVSTGPLPPHSPTTAANTNFQFMLRHATAEATQIQVRKNGVVSLNAAQARAPSASDAATVMTVGTPFGFLEVKVAEMAFFNSYLTAGEVTALEAYGVSRYGI